MKHRIEPVLAARSELEGVVASRPFSRYLAGRPRGLVPWPRSGGSWPSLEGAEVLSSSEADVVRLIALGYTNREVANLLAVPLRTVEARRARAMTRVGVTTRAQIVRHALETGLVDRP